MPSPLDGFRAFTPNLSIPSRDAGVIPFGDWFGTQEHLHAEIEAGLAEDVHDFVVLKGGRQVGGTTYCDALALWYLQSHGGMVGMYVSDDDDNMAYRRDVLLGMLDSLPKSHRWPVRQNNRGQLAWGAPNGSRLIFGAAGKRSGSNLGRSKGINFNVNDEVGSWVDQAAHSALRASRSKRHPLRLYIDVSTARGVGSVFHDLWKTAQRAVATRAIFMAWWRHAGYTLDPGTALWERYARRPITRDEAHWIHAVHERYGVTVTQGQVGWYRWQLAEEFMGDEALLAQEYGCLPEDCFQAFGDKFIPQHVIRRLRQELIRVPEPKGYRYEFPGPGGTFSDIQVLEADPLRAALRVWQEPNPTALYIIAAHPQMASGPTARRYVCQVYRAAPDRLRLVAEYTADEGQMYHFAWVVLHLAGAYRTFEPPYLIVEVGGSGMQVMAEIDRIEKFGHGLAGASLKDKERIINAVAGVRHYLYYRPDALRVRGFAKQNKVNAAVRAKILYALRDEVERGHLEIGSEPLIDELASLRRGEEGDPDVIGAGGGQDESRAIAAALAVEYWLTYALGELAQMVGPIAAGAAEPIGQALVGGFLASLGRTE